jgi:hypothetical protein
MSPEKEMAKPISVLLLLHIVITEAVNIYLLLLQKLHIPPHA